MITLVISDGEGSTTTVPLVLDEISIGRKEGNTIRLTERNISREHCRIQRVHDDYLLRDLKSYNGVSINGRRIEGESKLALGDEIRIGDYTVHFKSDAPAVSPPPPPPADPSKPPSPPPPPPVVDALEVEPTTVAALPKSPARLVVLTPPLAGAEFTLPESGEVRVGRAPELEVCIDHRSVSREHVKIVLEAGKARVVDLGSANGIVLNRETVTEATLDAGDLLELGDVVVRFVAAGESYVFDPIEARALGASRRPRARSQWLLAVGILGVALAFTFFVLSSHEPAPTAVAPEVVPEVAPAPAPEPPVVAPAAVVADDGARVPALVESCRAAVEGGRFAEGVAHANAALKLKPDSAEATACQQTARDHHDQEQMFVRAEAALESNDVESAWSELLGLPMDGAIGQRADVQKTTESVAAKVLSRAVALARKDADQGVALARSVAEREGLSADLRARAAKEIDRIEGARPQRVARAPERLAERSPERASEPSPRPAPSRPRSQPSEPPMETASACLARGDNACVVKALAGRANTAQELGLLIETYRALGESGQALRNMATYVQRFPSGRRAEAYRQMLARQGSP